MAMGKKKNNYIEQGGMKMVAMYPLFLLFFLKIAFMTRKIGASGIAYFAMGFAIFYLAYSINGVMISDTIRKMVIFQVNRRSVRNAIRLQKIIMEFSFLLTLVFGALLFVFSEKISVWLFVTPLVSLPIKCFAVLLLLMVPQQCLKGYLEGISSQVPGIVSMFIMLIIDLITTILLQNPCMEYGRKVSLLMHNDQYFYAYASLGGIAGLCVGSFFSMLFLTMITGLLKQLQRERMRTDESRTKLGRMDILHNYITNGFKDFISNLYGPVLILGCFSLYSHKLPEGFEELGMLFVSILSAVWFLIGSIHQGRFALRQVHSSLRKSDAAQARDKIAVQLKANIYYTLMLSVMLLFCARSFNVLLFDLTKDSLIGIFRYTLGILLLYAFAVVVLNILTAYTGQLLADIFYIVGALVFFLMQSVFAASDMAGISPFLGALLISMIWCLLAGGFVLFRKSRFKNDLIRVFVLPVIAAIALLLVCLLIDQTLFEKCGAAVCLLLSFGLGYLCYQLVIIMTRTFDKHEWNELPFSDFAVFLAKKMNMY